MNPRILHIDPDDWLGRDVGLRACSVPARGLWMDMRAIMAKAEPYGFLKIADRPVSPSDLAKIAGADEMSIVAWMDELRRNGVYSIDGDIIVSRTMIRENEIRSKRAAAGVLGGNPNVKRSQPINGEPQAHEIYEIYPKHVAKAAAIPKIEAAIHRHGAEKIRERTSAYREATARWPEADRCYIPHPATWFNQERYLDDPKAWDRSKPKLTAQQLAANVHRLETAIQNHPANPEFRGYFKDLVTPEMKNDLDTLRKQLKENRDTLNLEGVML